MSRREDSAGSGRKESLLARAGVGSGTWRPGAILREVKTERQAARHQDGASPQQRAAPLRGEEDTSPFQASPPAINMQAPPHRTPEGDTPNDGADRRRSPVPSGWYPGKFLGVGVRKAINKRLKNTNLEEKQRRQDGAKVVGSLHWRLKSVRGVQVFNPYLEVIYEGTKRVIKARTFQEEFKEQAGGQQPASNQWTETDLVFDVTDITASLYVLLIDKRLRTYTVGVLILPLANFLDVNKPKPPMTLVCDLVKPDFLDLDTKPLIGQRYTPQLSTDQQDSPFVTVGQLVVEVEVVMEHGLLQAYLASRPLKDDSFVKRRKADATSKEESLAQLEMEALVINIYRLQLAFKPGALVLLLLDWPFLTLPLWAMMCFTFEPWKAPLWALLFWSINGWLNSYNRLPGQVEAWPPGLVEKIEKMKQTRPMEKIKRIKGLFKWLQDKLGLAASVLERATHMWDWTDPRISLALHAVLLPVVALASLLLYLVPMNMLVFTLGFLVFAKASITRHLPPSPPPPPPPPQQQPPPPRDEEEEKARKEGGRGDEGEQEEEDEDEEDEGDDDDADLQLLDGRRDVIDPRLLLPRLVRNVLGRTPDYMEVLHRAIAAKRVRPAPMTAVS